jgi:hypothetical protein
MSKSFGFRSPAGEFELDLEQFGFWNNLDLINYGFKKYTKKNK